MQTIAITGATGFIGTRLTRALLREGCAVRALVLPDEALPAAWGGHVDVVRGDVRDFDAVQRLVAGTNAVYHLAAVVGDWGDPERFAQIAFEGTRAVAISARRQGARLVLVSSVVYYGQDIPRVVCDEGRLPGKALGPYSRAKQAQERLCWEFSRAAQLDLTVVRPTNVYGPDSGPWVRDVAAHLRRGLPALIGSGEADAGLVFVDNVVDLLLAARAPQARGRAYNVTDGFGVTWGRYFGDLANLLGTPAPRRLPRPLAALSAYAGEAVWGALRLASRPPITREALNLAGANLQVPTERARHELDWTPRVSYEDGLAQIAAWLPSSGLLP
jgi:nucleoside-diphosphate-sugar epimerase